MSDQRTFCFGVRNGADMRLLDAHRVPEVMWHVRTDVLKRKWFKERAPKNMWLDTGFDAFGNMRPEGKPDEDRFEWLSASMRDAVRNPPVAKLPARQALDEILHRLLDNLLVYSPSRITVPQIPFDKDSKKASRKVNLALATSSGTWLRTQKKFRGSLVLPVVFRNNSSYNTQTRRKAVVERIVELSVASRANAVWVVDEKVEDDCVPTKTQRDLLEPLLDLHIALRKESTINHVIGGPYWLFQHILLGRESIDETFSYPRHPFTYKILSSGSKQKGEKIPIVCLMPLLRHIRVISKETVAWLNDAANHLEPKEGEQFRDIVKLIRGGLTIESSEQQQADEYLGFIRTLYRMPRMGRSSQLFKVAMEARIIASRIGKELPRGSAGSGERVAERQPARVAEELSALILPR